MTNDELRRQAEIEVCQWDSTDPRHAKAAAIIRVLDALDAAIGIKRKAVDNSIATMQECAEKNIRIVTLQHECNDLTSRLLKLKTELDAARKALESVDDWLVAGRSCRLCGNEAGEDMTIQHADICPVPKVRVILGARSALKGGE